MQDSNTLLIVDIDATSAFPAGQLAFALGGEAYTLLSSAADALAALNSPSAPRHVVIDIGLRGEEIIPTLATLAGAAKGTSSIVVVGSINDLGFYRALRQVGIEEYFTHPANVQEVRAALLAKRGAPKFAPNAQAGQVIAFMSAASGDGASTVALNTAYALSQEARSQTVLADFDYQFGMIARHVDAQAQFGIRELFDYPDRGVDATLVSKMLMPYGAGMHIIAAPEHLHGMPSVRPETVRELIAVLRSQFPYVLLDVPHVWTPWTAEALKQADKIVLVSQLWLRSLTHLSRLLGAFAEAGISRDKVFIVSNRSGARFREGITPEDFERVCLKPINFHLANDIKTVVAAENKGKTVVETSQSPLEKQFRDLARILAGLGVQSTVNSQGKTNIFKRLFGKGSA